MNDLFISLLNRSVSAGWLILTVLALRLVLKKAPKWSRILLWGLVGLRLVCPFSLKSVFSLLPSAQTFPTGGVVPNSVNGSVHSGITYADTQINGFIASHSIPGVNAAARDGFDVMRLLALVWLCGTAVMLGYLLISSLLLKRKIRVSVGTDDGIRVCDAVDSPFIFGIIRPKIYLPSSLPEEYLPAVTAHEKAHIRRGDHLIKPFAFLLLSLYWFHPLIWAAYIFLCRDIELACDERAIKDADEESRKHYSSVLLACSVRRRTVAACPVAFGETGVKQRIGSVLSYKKPAVWLIAAALAAGAITAVCFLTDPVGKNEFTKDANGGSVYLTGCTITQDICFQDGVLSKEKVNQYIADEAVFIVSPTDELYKHYPDSEEYVPLGKIAEADVEMLWESDALREVLPEKYAKQKLKTAFMPTGEKQGTFPVFFITQKEDAIYAQTSADGKTLLRVSLLSVRPTEIMDDADCVHYTSDAAGPLHEAGLTLDTKNSAFMFNYSPLSSYIAMGRYQEDGDRITLTTDDAQHYVFVFDKVSEGLRFNAAASAKLPEYLYSETGSPEPCVADGTVFRVADEGKFSLLDDSVIEKAVSDALLSGGDSPCFGEGHIIRKTSTSKKTVTAECVAMTTAFSEENGCLRAENDDVFTLKLVFDRNKGKLTVRKFETSPAENTVDYTGNERTSLRRQCFAYAFSYLKVNNKEMPVCRSTETGKRTVFDIVPPEQKLEGILKRLPEEERFIPELACVNRDGICFETFYDEERDVINFGRYDAETLKPTGYIELDAKTGRILGAMNADIE